MIFYIFYNHFIPLKTIRSYNYPYAAIEESLANAVYYRSYEKENSIEVNVREDRIEIYKKSILKFCQKEKIRKEIMDYIGLDNRQENAKRHLQPLIDSSYVRYLYPHVPQTPKQKYIITEKGVLKL